MGFDIPDPDAKSGITAMNHNTVYKVLNYAYHWTYIIVFTYYQLYYLYISEEKNCIVECGKLARNFGGQYEESMFIFNKKHDISCLCTSYI